jgi:ribonuclease HI
MAADLRSLKMYIDGACPGNQGGPGGFAIWLQHPFDADMADEFLEARGYFHTTNNRMEIRACLAAHEWIFERGDAIGVQHVEIVTDSKYVSDGYRNSVYWYQSDWCNAAGREMENVDLWKDVLRLRRKLKGRPRIEVILIPRCSTEIAKRVDRDAKAAARAPHFEDSGYRPGKIGRSRHSDGKAARMYPADGQEIIIMVYNTRPNRKGVQTIKFQIYSEEKRDFFEKFWARGEDRVGNSLHRGNCYLVKMNDLPANPRIMQILATLDKSELIGHVAVGPRS